MTATARITLRLAAGTSTFVMAKAAASVLEAAEAAGLDLPSLCRAGLCATCRARVTSGSVEMQVNMVLEPEELAAGYVLACQSRPLSDEVVLEFDPT
jgi:ring-1,2-phenylacetyl-CoA epoxidase subunit PaaE